MRIDRILNIGVYSPYREEANGDGDGSAGGGALGAAGGSTEPNGAAGGTAEGAEGADAPAGALGGEGGGAAEPNAAPDGIDWDKITDDEYMAKVTAPEGRKLELDALKRYGELLRKNKIDPKVFSEFIALDAKAAAEAEAEEKKSLEAAQKTFDKMGEELRAEYTPEQVKSANEALNSLGDPAFVKMVAKSPLSNSKTLVKLLLAYKDANTQDGVPGAGGVSAKRDMSFADAWKGGR